MSGKISRFPWKPILGVWMTLFIVLGISLPMVPQPQHWYDLPLIPGLEERARNIFFHVPSAWLSAIGFIASLVYGIRYLRRKEPLDDIRSASAASLGLLFCIIATVTGAIWAKFNWGTFWNWDPRETSIFVLLLIYGAYFALRSAVDGEEKRATLSAVYSIVAGVVMPFFLFILPRITSGLHPGSADDTNMGPAVSSGGMDAKMRVLMYGSFFGFVGLYYWMWTLQVKVSRLDTWLTEHGGSGD